MARRERQGFMIYHDVAVNTLQYLPADEFKAVIMAAVEYSIAQAAKKEAPEFDFSGITLGAYRQLCSGTDYSAYQWMRKACFNRMAKRQEKQADLVKLSVKALEDRGYSKSDIAIIKDMPLEDVIRIQTVTDGNQRSPTVTNITELELNKDKTETDIHKNSYQESHHERHQEREREGEASFLMSHADVMNAITQRAKTDVPKANEIINKCGEDRAMELLAAWEETNQSSPFDLFCMLNNKKR